MLLGTTCVAIKVMRPGILSKEDVLKEVTVLKTLRHARIVELLCVCTDEEPVWIVTEFMEHGNLRDYLHLVDRTVFTHKCTVFNTILQNAVLEDKIRSPCLMV
jgi:serine/threonine protein kinase